MYENNTQNADFSDLNFDGGEVLIARRPLYHINYNIVSKFNNGLSVYV